MCPAYQHYCSKRSFANYIWHGGLLWVKSYYIVFYCNNKIKLHINTYIRKKFYLKSPQYYSDTSSCVDFSVQPIITNRCLLEGLTMWQVHCLASEKDLSILKILIRRVWYKYWWFTRLRIYMPSTTHCAGGKASFRISCSSHTSDS